MSDQNALNIDYSFANEYAAQAPEGILVLHKDFHPHDMLKFIAPNTKRHFSGVFKTNHPESYFQYLTKRRNESKNGLNDQTFVNAENPLQHLTATTFLNFGTTDKPETCDDIAVLELKKDPVLAQLCNEACTYQNANDFAIVLEEFLNLDVLQGLKQPQDGEETKAINLKACIKAFKNLKIDRVNQSENHEEGYTQSTSEMEQVSINNTSENLPDYMVLTSPIYLNLPTQKLVFAIDKHYKAREKGTDLNLRLRLIGSHNYYLKAAENFKEMLSDKLENALIGTF